MPTCQQVNRISTRGVPPVASDRWFAFEAAVKNVNYAFGGHRGRDAAPLTNYGGGGTAVYISRVGLSGKGGGVGGRLMGLRGCAVVMLKAAGSMNI